MNGHLGEGNKIGQVRKPADTKLAAEKSTEQIIELMDQRMNRQDQMLLKYQSRIKELEHEVCHIVVVIYSSTC